MAFKMRSGNKPGFKKMGATNAMKQVDTMKAAKGKGSEREIYKAKLRGDYMDLTGSKLKEMSYDDPTGTVVSKRHKSPMKAKDERVKIGGKMYPKGYTKKDVEFLKSQKEDVVRYEDLDAKGRAIWKKQGKAIPKSPAKKLDNKAKQKEIKSFIKSNMNKMSDVDLMKKIRKMSDNKTEYNWNNKSGKVESHPVKSKEK